MNTSAIANKGARSLRGAVSLSLVMGIVAVLIAASAGYVYFSYNAKSPAGASRERASDGLSLGGPLDCKSADADKYVKEFLNDPTQKLSGSDCMGKAMVECRPAVYTLRSSGQDDFVYTVEGKSGANCTITDTGSFNLMTKVRSPGRRCTYALADMQKYYQDIVARNESMSAEMKAILGSPYNTVNLSMGSSSGEGTFSDPLPMTCTRI